MASYLTSVYKQFKYYKNLGDKTIAQLSLNQIKQEIEKDTNSIAIIVNHLSGNMISRWTNFLTEDGEKSWRQRDSEFIETFTSKAKILEVWEKGWACFFEALKSIEPSQLEDIIYIRNQGHTITEAINRQMMHYSYHIGQIVLIGKLIKGEKWECLSIQKGASNSYNNDKFSKEKSQKHFTEDL